MKHLMPDIGVDEPRQFYAIRHGLLDGCEAYLSKRDRFPLRAGTYEREIRSRFAILAKDAGVFLDIGAAEGFFSVYMLRHTDARVYAFENESVFGDVLVRNLERNTRNGHRVMVTDRPVGRQTYNGLAWTVDRIVGNQEGPVLLKIDAESAETDVLQGAERILEREDTRVMVKLHTKHAEAQCMWLLDEHGFNVEIIGQAWWRTLVKDRASDEGARWLIADKEPIDGLFS
ncbi:MAG: FkbM family methyltransferase [Verrucomicrobiae bacterium]|nr:FkbM family methyltransferase [Verrucomicrobiae bacterium]MCP5541783.1 FkbM family methyltransferase [Akkermansiaceae bacterium]